MMDPGRSLNGTFRTVIAALALCGLAGVTGAQPAAADEAQAKQMFKAMTDYLAGQQAFSFKYDATLDIVTADMMKLGLASSGSLTLQRPDKARMTRTGVADVELTYDGKTVSAIGKHLNVYTKIPLEGSVDDMIDTLRFAYGVEAPAADLLSPNAFAIMMENVTAAKDLGSGVIGGEVCNHLAFRTVDTDWEVWIADGDVPRPCRFTITSRMMAMAPSYTVQISDWKAGKDVAADDFQLQTGDAKEVKIEEMRGLDELAGLLEEGNAK
ncbi:DUF2092 domain-containing protein [Mesorhizobium sp. KR9-304]|uniref:DUF2092 domain-containing protein n=1 Tax=Mesorhizobium sp. KR9-304 TaxID=3156614 RepID=UPI0032B461F2